jgi:hypothetical protein
MKLSVLFRLLDLGQSAVLLGQAISSSHGLCYLPQVIVMMEKLVEWTVFGRGNRSTRRKPAPTPDRARTWVVAVGSQRLTTSAMVRPKNVYNDILLTAFEHLLLSAELSFFSDFLWPVVHMLPAPDFSMNKCIKQGNWVCINKWMFMKQLIPYYIEYKTRLTHISYWKIEVHLKFEELFTNSQTVQGVAWKEPDVNTFRVSHQATLYQSAFNCESTPHF